MQDVTPPPKDAQTATNSIPVAQAPDQQAQQPSSPASMDIKTEPPKKPVEAPGSPQQEKPTAQKKEKKRSNIGIIILACFVCAVLVGLAIYLKMQSTTVEN